MLPVLGYHYAQGVSESHSRSTFMAYFPRTVMEEIYFDMLIFARSPGAELSKDTHLTKSRT